MNGVKKLIGLGLLVGFFNVCAYASFDQREDVLQWLDEADSLGFTKAEVVNYLAKTTAKPSIVPILRNAPERKLLWSGYQQRLVTSSRIKRGIEFAAEHTDQLNLMTNYLLIYAFCTICEHEIVLLVRQIKTKAIFESATVICLIFF